MENTILITSGRLAGYLMLSGLKLLRVRRDLKDPARHVFIFDDTPLLRRYMAAYPEAKAAAYRKREELVG